MDLNVVSVTCYSLYHRRRREKRCRSLLVQPKSKWSNRELRAQIYTVLIYVCIDNNVYIVASSFCVIGWFDRTIEPGRRKSIGPVLVGSKYELSEITNNEPRGYHVPEIVWFFPHFIIIIYLLFSCFSYTLITFWRSDNAQTCKSQSVFDSCLRVNECTWKKKKSWSNAAEIRKRCPVNQSVVAVKSIVVDRARRLHSDRLRRWLSSSGANRDFGDDVPCRVTETVRHDDRREFGRLAPDFRLQAPDYL